MLFQVSSQPTMPAPFPSSLTTPSLPPVVPDPSPQAHKLLGDRPRGPIQPSALISILHPLHAQPPVGRTVKPSQKQPCQAVPPLSTGRCSGVGVSWGRREPITGGTLVCQANASSDGPWHLWASSASRKGAQVPTLHPLHFRLGLSTSGRGGSDLGYASLCSPRHTHPLGPEPASVPGTRSRSPRALTLGLAVGEVKVRVCAKEQEAVAVDLRASGC